MRKNLFGVLALLVVIAGSAQFADAQTFGNAGNYGIIAGGSGGVGAPPVTLTTARNLTASDAGSTFINAGATGTVTLPITPGLQVGTEFTLYETDAFNFGVTTSGGETIQVSTTNQTSCAAQAKGANFKLKKLTPTLWGLMPFVGAVG